MKLDSIGLDNWDTIMSNNWARPANLNTYLNGTYLSSLSSTAQNQISAKNFSIGAVAHDDTNLENTVNDEKAIKWNGKIALPTVSEYIRSNSDIDNCGTMNQIWNSSACNNTSWMYNNTSWWTLSPISRDSESVFLIDGSLRSEYVHYFGSYNVRPALYLSSEVKITGGDGSQSNPYTIM